MSGKLRLPLFDSVISHYHIDLCINENSVKPQEFYIPGDMVYVILSQNNSKILDAYRWGFQPQEDSALATARVETVNLKNLWRLPFERQRCIVPILGFEAHREFVIANEEIASVAAIYTPGSHGRKPQVAILTTPSLGELAHVTNRVPAVVAPDQIDTWLRGDHMSSSDLQRSLISNDPGYKILA
jgi:putative SOS response-associated peptidase YedK